MFMVFAIFYKNQDEFQGLYSPIAYPVWPPYASFQAASVMLDLLDEETTKTVGQNTKS